MKLMKKDSKIATYIFFIVILVSFHTHANHSADWRGANTVMGPKGLPLAEGDFKWAAPVTIRTLIK